MEQIQQSLSKLERRVEDGNKKLSKIESYLYDDSETSTPGLVQKHRNLEKRVETLEDAERLRKGIAATLGVIGGAVLMALWELAKWLLSNHKP